MTDSCPKLASFLAEIAYDRLPEAVVHEVKRRVLDVFGIALSGVHTEMASWILKYVRGQEPGGPSLVWISGDETSPALAALANAAVVFHMELDDVHRTSHTHPAVTTIPTALAMAEAGGHGGRDVIEAIVAGYEIQTRLGRALSPSIYLDRPLMPAVILGTFGSAGTAAKLKNFDAQQTWTAMGTAAFLTPLAIFENYSQGSTSRNLGVGWASMAGIMSADMTGYGFGGPASWLDGPLGFGVAAADRFDPSHLSNGLGESYQILETGVKPYACCRQHHTAIDAALEIRKLHRPDIEQVEKIILRTYKVAGRGCDPAPQNINTAKYSAPYGIAVALLEGGAWQEQYTQDKIKDGRILGLARKVEVIVDHDLDALYDEKWPSIVEVYLKEGRCLSARRDLPKGEPEDPYSDEELVGKFFDLAETAVSRTRAEAIAETIGRLEKLENIRELTGLLRVE